MVLPVRESGGNVWSQTQKGLYVATNGLSGFPTARPVEEGLAQRVFRHRSLGMGLPIECSANRVPFHASSKLRRRRR